MTTEEQIRAEIESIDWDAIRDQSRIEDIGSTLYELASELDDLGYEGTVAAVAGIMDGFTAHRLRIGDDAKRVAAGFGKAMIRAAANGLAHPDDDEETS